MSGLEDVAVGAGGLIAGQIWKVSTFSLLTILLVGGGAGGALWWSAAAERDQAQDDLKAAQGVNAQLRAGIDTQNRAITQWYEASKAAEARGAAAQHQAVAVGQRYDAALQQLSSARASSCEDAMPYVNQLLEKVR